MAPPVLPVTHTAIEAILSKLDDKGVKFLLVGGLAVQRYIPVYLTHDIDLWVKPTAENVTRLMYALTDFGWSPLQLAHLRETRSSGRFRFPCGTTLDLFQDIDGAALMGGFAKAWYRRTHAEYGELVVSCLSVNDLILHTLAPGREKKLELVHRLFEARRYLECRAAYRRRKLLSVDDGPPDPPLLPWRGYLPTRLLNPPPPPRPRLFVIWRNEHMLSIAKVGGGGKYHGYLTGEYYLDSGPAAVWMGAGATGLGLEGKVSERQFRRLGAGFSPTDKKPKPLVMNAGMTTDHAKGTRGHVQGWDLTFSAPKSVSVLWAIGSGTVREQITECHRQAVRDALQYLEDEAAWTRRGKGGENRTRAKLVVAAFDHSTNRELEPQLHTHAVVKNVCVGVEDGRTGTLDSRPLYRHKMTAGALYQASLAAALVERLGVTVRSERVAFAVEGVPEELCERFSTRRKQVLDALQSFGRSSPQAAAVAAHATKRKKEPLPVEHLSTVWQEIGTEFGFTTKEAEALRSDKVRHRSPEATLQGTVSQATEKLLVQESHFTEQQLIRQAATLAIGSGANAAAIRSAVRTHLTSPGGITPLGEHQGEQRFTTDATLAEENSMIADVERLAGRHAHAVNPKAAKRVLDNYFSDSSTEDRRKKNAEQRAAVEQLLDAGGFKVLSGMAGTGKSTALRACREAWEASGYRVLGGAVAGKAARGLEQSSGIESNTLASLLVRLDATGSPGAMVVHHAKSMWRTAIGKQPHKPFFLTPDTVLVVDEAGMVGTKQMAKLTRYAEKAGAKLVLVGDEGQLQPIDAGGPFAHFAKRFDAVRLTHIIRQSLDPSDRDPEWKRKAVKEFASGQAKEALTRYAERGLVTVKKDRTLAVKALVADWLAGGGLVAPKDNLIFASTNDEVRKLNGLCQEARGTPPPSEVLRKGVKGQQGEVILTGDRILMTEKCKRLGIENGDLGTVRDVTGKTGRRVLVVEFDDAGKAVEIPTHEFAGFRLGYAMTTHKGQGVTCKNAFVMVGGSMQDRHLSYVQASRAVETTRFYMDRFEAGPRLEAVASLASKDRSKDLAHDVLNPPKPSEPKFGFGPAH